MRVSLPESVFPPGGGGEILKLGELFRITEWHERLAWRPFRPKVEIYRLYGDEIGPRAALLRFQPGGRVPLHEHTGYEHILVLAGSQEDDTGIVKAGDLVINAPGTRHSVLSREGCVVLAVYEKPVKFIGVDVPVI